MNPIHLRMLCAKFGWNWPGGSGEEDILKVVNLFLLFPKYLLFGKGVPLHLNKLESPSTWDTLCKVWLKLAQWVWRRWKCEKLQRRTDRQTDDGRQMIRKAPLSFQLRWLKTLIPIFLHLEQEVWIIRDLYLASGQQLRVSWNPLLNYTKNCVSELEIKD